MSLTEHRLPGFLMVHNTSRSCEHDISKLTRRQELHNPLLEIGETDIVSRGDDTSLVKTMNELEIMPKLVTFELHTGRSTIE
jgi:hypothetical protein